MWKESRPGRRSSGAHDFNQSCDTYGSPSLPRSSSLSRRARRHHRRSSNQSAGAQPGATSAQSDEATESAEPRKVFSGSVIETMNSGGYTYLHLKGGSDDVGRLRRVRREDRRDDIGVARHANAELPEPNAEPDVSAAVFRAGGRPQRSDGRGCLASCCTGTDAGARGTGVAPAVQRIEPPAGGTAIADVFAKKGTLAGKAVLSGAPS